jgi:hypothetical protein
METNKLNLGKRDEIIKKCYLKINMWTEKKEKGVVISWHKCLRDTHQTCKWGKYSTKIILYMSFHMKLSVTVTSYKCSVG